MEGHHNWYPSSPSRLFSSCGIWTLCRPSSRNASIPQGTIWCCSTFATSTRKHLPSFLLIMLTAKDTTIGTPPRPHDLSAPFASGSRMVPVQVYDNFDRGRFGIVQPLSPRPVSMLLPSCSQLLIVKHIVTATPSRPRDFPAPVASGSNNSRYDTVERPSSVARYSRRFVEMEGYVHSNSGRSSRRDL